MGSFRKYGALIASGVPALVVPILALPLHHLAMLLPSSIAKIATLFHPGPAITA